jgi:dihydroflavonol-4-reductase
MSTADSQACFWASRCVAITGATGFLGYHLATQLAGLGARVRALVRPTASPARLIAAGVDCVRGDLQDTQALNRLCRSCEFVFHVAAAVDFEDDWERFHQINVEGSQRIAQTAHAAGVRRLIHTSSMATVGATAQPRALDETATWNLGGLRVPYVTTKRHAEEAILAAPGGLEVVVVNPGSVVGPDDFSASEFGTLCKRFWHGRLPVYFGGGSNFVDVRDVAAGHLLAAQRGRPGQRYLLTGRNRTYTAFFADLARAASRPIFRVRVPQLIGDGVAALHEKVRRKQHPRPYLTLGQARLMALYFYFDCAKARRELGFEPRPLARSLADAHRFWMGRRSA